MLCLKQHALRLGQMPRFNKRDTLLVEHLNLWRKRLYPLRLHPRRTQSKGYSEQCPIQIEASRESRVSPR
ncbi:MAG: hypothetical protein NVSMB62_23410 [Acidobacteriaceae bacterium]